MSGGAARRDSASGGTGGVSGRGMRRFSVATIETDSSPNTAAAEALRHKGNAELAAGRVEDAIDLLTRAAEAG
eukprot:CAMPEP_0203818560 /NCGR_PEP_ID=MMETSP0115-20131106/32001_1 /ASSEMBLY_ACC=CAM_ASM_000227 /TAXON_ID=33651 /ORGANISM="Bicosoecid sp, Strain ms1" /LENGTH=72 /DNA_ID=CAMNT_0050727525 /DNA_START=62 /DNA_END=276 /DNA_ORIENTATION=-